MVDYTIHLLCYGNGADLHYTTIKPRLGIASLPVADNLSDQDVLIVGGFPRIHPDSTTHLSPTLLLNGELVRYNDSEMTDIGRAELIRCNSQTFRSYLLKADPRVAVIGTSAASLHSFIDRYSGILQVEPLLVDDFAPGLPTVNNLHVSSENNSYRITCDIRQPIDLERCTYCGSCGSVCPELCISELLFLNFAMIADLIPDYIHGSLLTLAFPS